MRNLDFVKRDVLMAIRPQAEGRGIGDEVDLVSALRQLDPQFRGDHSAAAVRWIARDADFHVGPKNTSFGFAKHARDAESAVGKRGNVCLTVLFRLPYTARELNQW